MGDQDIKIASSATGVVAALRPRAAGDDSAGNGRPAPGNPMPQAQQESPDAKELARGLNLASQSIGRDLRFEVDMESGKSVIQVLDRETGEVIRQIPPDKADVVLTKEGWIELRLYDALV